VFVPPVDDGPPTAAHAKLGSEGVLRLRGRYAEMLARIDERTQEADRRAELKAISGCNGLGLPETPHADRGEEEGGIAAHDDRAEGRQSGGGTRAVEECVSGSRIFAGKASISDG